MRAHIPFSLSSSLYANIQRHTMRLVAFFTWLPLLSSQFTTFDRAIIHIVAQESPDGAPGRNSVCEYITAVHCALEMYLIILEHPFMCSSSLLSLRLHSFTRAPPLCLCRHRLVFAIFAYPSLPSVPLHNTFRRLLSAAGTIVCPEENHTVGINTSTCSRKKRATSGCPSCNNILATLLMMMTKLAPDSNDYHFDVDVEHGCTVNCKLLSLR